MSDHWLLKMRTYFKRIDFDGDGQITRADFEGMAKRFGDSGKLTADQAKSLAGNLTAVWDKHLVNVAKGKGIDRDTFIETMKTTIKDTETIKGPLPFFFRAVDSNNDGFISSDEYSEFFGTLGLDAKQAPASFKAIDTNNDDLLSEDEFVAAGTQFFQSDDKECPTRFFWGTLDG